MLMLVSPSCGLGLIARGIASNRVLHRAAYGEIGSAVTFYVNRIYSYTTVPSLDDAWVDDVAHRRDAQSGRLVGRHVSCRSRDCSVEHTVYCHERYRNRVTSFFSINCLVIRVFFSFSVSETLKLHEFNTPVLGAVSGRRNGGCTLGSVDFSRTHLVHLTEQRWHISYNYSNICTNTITAIQSSHYTTQRSLGVTCRHQTKSSNSRPSHPRIPHHRHGCPPELASPMPSSFAESARSAAQYYP